ncbi:PDZ domain-containing protein [Cardiobacteriaceae bacterium TAE3-ERU3]|nr:PDZ domain-containing protein [Cardiobacteriaceae bacterium TAE3-ERU3]
MIDYLITAADGGHRFNVEQRVPVSGGQEYTLYLPVWIPGSYTRRDFSKYLRNLTAKSGGEVLPWQMINPSTWQVSVPQGAKELVLTYNVYARDISVRGNYLDHERGIINPCCTCIAVEGMEDMVHRIELALADGWQWYGAEALNGRVCCDDYDHLIDTPLMLGAALQHAEFDVYGKRHELVVSGAKWDYDFERLVDDARKICIAEHDMFGGWPKATQDYCFMLHATDNVYGGLEHRSSTMLMAPRALLPRTDGTISPNYIRLLGLFSHEYFHTWNVKDLKPADYQPYDVRQEQPSEMLWFFEGFTAYFDNLLLVQSGVIKEEHYWQLLADDITNHTRRRGHKHQTLAHSSYEAWTKLYNGGEDALNSSTNYYVHGALFAFCLDMFLRTQSDDDISLASVLRGAWQQYSEDGQGMTEARFVEIVSGQLPKEVEGEFTAFLQRGLHSLEPLPLAESLAAVGMHLSMKADSVQGKAASSEPGFRWRDDHGKLRVTRLDEGSSAARAGIAVDDELVAVDNIVASEAMLRRCLLESESGRDADIHVFRDGILHHFTVELEGALKDKACIEPVREADAATQARRRAWLKQAD